MDKRGLDLTSLEMDAALHVFFVVGGGGTMHDTILCWLFSNGILINFS